VFKSFLPEHAVMDFPFISPKAVGGEAVRRMGLSPSGRFPIVDQDLNFSVLPIKLHTIWLLVVSLFLENKQGNLVESVRNIFNI
jgi:hypothetical protein